MFLLKLMLVFGVIVSVTLARPNQSAYDIEALDLSSHEDDNGVSNEPLVRKRRQNLLQAIVSTYLFTPFGVRGDWRFCRTTPQGASIYTNGIDVVCRGLCTETEITCNDYYRPYFYNYFQ